VSQHLGCNCRIRVAAFFPLPPRLMVGVHVHERAVKPNRAFVERDQCTDVKCIDLWNAERDRIALAFVKRRARATKKSLQIIAARYASFDLKFFRGASFRTSIKVAKKIRHPIAQLLHIGMLVGRAFVP